MLDRLRRVTDLFVEGAEAFFGLDDEGAPVVIWVNKLNSFEVEEARQDGMSARGLALLRLDKEDNPERMALVHTIATWDDDQLLEAIVNQKGDELYLEALNDLESDEDWREKLQMIRRVPVVLDDSKAPDDDPRRATLADLQNEYLEEIRKRQEKARAGYKRKYDGVGREELERDYFENWRSRASLDDFMAERRITELFYAMRDCKATQESGRAEDGQIRWNHAKCDHSVRLLNERSQVRALPEAVISRVADIIDGVTVSPRESGNSDAPQSSSESAERPSEAEVSTPSTPKETEPAAPTT